MTRYILLNPDDVIEAGDEFLVPSDDGFEWHHVIGSIGLVPKNRQEFIYRRGITSCRHCGHDPLSTED